ncbi:MAG: DUF2341 domain-containing protein [Theionarchaea archaeon]|nr:DUF2341 domain-containing protein [Theionarchaea archaeon]
MKRKLKHLLLISVLLMSFLQCIEFTRAEDWGYYKEITISDFSGDYQKKITVYYGSGSDSTDTVYLSSHCQTDFDDVQFRASDQSTVLKHWKEEYTTSTSATFWVKLPSSSQSIYIYYGNSEATDSSDPSNVFIHFDDCEGTDPTGYWTENDSSYGDVEYTTEDSKHGSKSMKSTQTSSSSSYKLTRTISETDFIFEFSMKQTASDNYNWVLAWESGAQKLTARWDTDTNMMYYTDQYIDTGYDYTVTWVEHRFTFTEADDVIKWELNDTVIAADAHRATFTSIDTITIFQGYYTYVNDSVFYDDIRIRKYAATVPTFSFGSEQSTNSPPNTPTNYSPSNGASDQVLNPVLTWSTYSDPESDPQQAYEVRIDNNSDFSSPEWTGSGTTGNSTTVNTNGTFANDCAGQTELNEDEQNFWQTRVQDDQGNWSEWSTYTSFTTDIFSPTCSLVSPSNQSTGISLNPTLEWSYNDHNGDPIQNCDVIIDDNADFSSKEAWTGLLGGGAVTSLVVNATNFTFYNNCAGQTQLDENTLYYWKVKVQDNTGRWSEYSGVTEFTTGTIPAAPTNCTASYISDSQIDVSWTDNSSNEAGFKIYRSVDGGSYSLFTTETENSTGTNDTTVSSDHYYQYRVESYNDIGSSSQCETAIVYTSPLAPSNVQASLNDPIITLTWTDNSSITDLHEIERSIDGGDWAYLDEDSDGSYQDTWQEAWSSVKYRVRAKATGPRYSSFVESNTLTANQPPEAAFTFWGSGGTEITFDARASSDPDEDELTYNWDLGNGDTAQGDFITYDYDTGGTWTVTLTVSDGENEDQIQKTVTINVSSGSSRPSSPSTPAEAVDQIFEIVGDGAKETFESAKDDTIILILIGVVILLVVFSKKRKR